MTKHLYILTGASRGMGLAMAHQLIQPENTLVCISRHANPELSHAALERDGHVLQWGQDLSDGAQAAQRLQQWLDNAQNTGDQTPAFASATLINNAGVMPRPAPLSASDVQELALALRVGLEAPMLLCAAFLAATEHWNVPRKILNISSGLGRKAKASQAAYCAAKAGMDHFSRSLALDEAHKTHGAKVCSLAPGVIDTDMQIQLRSADPTAFPDMPFFAGLKKDGLLTSPDDAAVRVLAWLNRADFGDSVVADVREG